MEEPHPAVRGGGLGVRGAQPTAESVVVHTHCVCTALEEGVVTRIKKGEHPQYEDVPLVEGGGAVDGGSSV